MLTNTLPKKFKPADMEAELGRKCLFHATWATSCLNYEIFLEWLLDVIVIEIVPQAVLKTRFLECFLTVNATF